LKKCMPMKRSGASVAAASWVMLMLLVLLATIVTLAFFGMPEQDKTTASKRRERHDG